MLLTFYVAAAIAVISTALTITRLKAVHALLYLVISLLAIATVFFTLGAPFVAALEAIVYAGAIMVLFIFVMMLLNIGDRATRSERTWLNPKHWAGPAILAAILLAEFACVLLEPATSPGIVGEVGPKQVSIALFGPYLIGVELVSMLLLAGIVGAYHLGWNDPGEVESVYAGESSQQRAVVSGSLVRAGVDGPADAP
ncbi:MAG TPA: NADH-quinone oxidoreductase subunit J [Acidobacteriaceae bacterium]